MVPAIAIFAYNRPTHVERMLETLLANPGLNRSLNIYVFVDGPKKSEDRAQVLGVQRLVEERLKHLNVVYVFRAENIGLARSLSGGISEVLTKHDAVIVLEDDLELSPYFLEYMVQALKTYKNDSQVMHVSGFMYPIALPFVVGDTLFLQEATCWGWATWARAWKHFEWDATKLKQELIRRGLMEYFDAPGAGYFEMLQGVLEGKINSWAIRWYASIFLNTGLSLHPKNSLVQNTGHDGSGINSEKLNFYSVTPCTRPLIVDGNLPKFVNIETELALKKFREDIHEKLKRQPIKDMLAMPLKKLGLFGLIKKN